MNAVKLTTILMIIFNSIMAMEVPQVKTIRRITNKSKDSVVIMFVAESKPLLKTYIAGAPVIEESKVGEAAVKPNETEYVKKKLTLKAGWNGKIVALYGGPEQLHEVVRGHGALNRQAELDWAQLEQTSNLEITDQGINVESSKLA